MSDSVPAYVCGFSDDDGGGLYRFAVDVSNGTLERRVRHPLAEAMFCAPTTDGSHVYVTSRLAGGEVAAVRVDGPEELTELNRQPSGGGGPCYVSVDGRNRYAFVANYGGGSIAMLPIGDDGRLGPATDVVEHDGSSVDPNRQTEPHPHSIVPGPNDRFVYVPDLGTDTVAIYEVDYEAGRFDVADASPARLHDAAGPRHLAFHPSGAFAYVIDELDSTVTAFAADAETGALDAVESVSTLPETFDGDNLCAEVRVHPSGEFLFGSNRGHDSIVVLAIDERTGRLDTVAHETTDVEWPRHFGIDPAGECLLVGNRHDDSIVTFDVDRRSGELTPTGHRREVPDPICVQFV